MRFLFNLLLVVLLVGVFLVPSQQATAQTLTQHDTANYISNDTMYVAYWQTGPAYRLNALRTAIMGDTLAGNVRASATRIYYLKSNGYYFEADDIAASFPLTIVSAPMSSLAAGVFPPVLQIKKRADGTSANHLITANDNATLRNIWVTGRNADDRTQGGAYQPILYSGASKRYILDGCVFEYSDFALVVVTGAHNSVYITNNKFQNLQEYTPTQQWTGRAISVWTDEDTVIIENNSFFNIGMTAYQNEGGSTKYSRFNHNTLINIGRILASGGWWQTAFFTNNLIINGAWQGEGWGDTRASSGRDPRQHYEGLFGIGILPSSYGVEASRRVVIAKNYAYLDPAIVTKYGATVATDSIWRAWFIDPVSALDYAIPYAVGGAAGGHMYVKDTVWLTSLPAGFTNYLTNADWLKPLNTGTAGTMVDSMWSFITNIRNGTPGKNAPLFYKPTVNSTDEAWPLTWSGAYTDASLMIAGSDGLPMGDLNWFPTQKATFLANQATYVQAIDNLAGVVDHYYADSLAEAEDGSVGGTSAVKPVLGFPYYDGPGDILFTFNVATAGKIDSIVINTNRKGNGDRGQNFLLDGNQFHNATSWGELHFYGGENGSNASAWYTKKITVDSINATALATANAAAIALFTSLPAGTHTLHVTSSWGGQAFGEVDLYVAGNKIALTIPAAVCTKGTPVVLNSPWAPSKYKFVELGTAGTIAWTIAAPKTGNYVLSINYQNGGSSAQSVQLMLGSTVLTSPSLTAKSDSSEQTVVSGKFALTAGNNTITMSGAGARIDYVQLFQYVIGAVGKNGPPSEYALEQNYPNPFNPTTTINFSIGQVTNVKLRVYNILGQQVMTLVDTRMTPGAHSVVFDAAKLSSGVYFYRLEAGNFVSVKKMLLLK